MVKRGPRMPPQSGRFWLSVKAEVFQSVICFGTTVKFASRQRSSGRNLCRIDVDYGQIVKFYDAEPIGPGRYAPPRVTGAERTVIAGSPDQAHISTSHVERQNLMMRMSMRRFTRLTNAFSKKFENLQAAVALHFAHYNLVRLHKTLRVTPAMAANVTDRVWSLEELVERTSK